MKFVKHDAPGQVLSEYFGFPVNYKPTIAPYSHVYTYNDAIFVPVSLFWLTEP
jgi:hypothetical protein